MKSLLNATASLSMSTRWWLPIALVVYVTTAWCSEGYYHLDEHFQILEFADYKLGRIPASNLPWEFSSHVRPGLQPLLAYSAIRAAEFVGITNPFTQAFLMRLVTGLLSLWMFKNWGKELAATPGTEAAGRSLPWIVVLLWFVPFLSVRFSSENVAALAFWTGVLLIVRGVFGSSESAIQSTDNLHADPIPGARYETIQALQSFSGGLLLGLSFYFRFQIGISILGVCAWTAWRLVREQTARASTSRIFLIIAGGATAVAIGTSADYWLYGEPVFSALNYLQVNILHGKAAEFGTEPWWFYFFKIFINGPPPIALLGLTLIGIGIWRNPGNVMAWAPIPFVLTHIVIGHKELRFLFPMILPSLILAALGWQALFTGGALSWLKRHRPTGTFLTARGTTGAGAIQQSLFYSLRARSRQSFVGILALMVLLAIALNSVLLPVRCLAPAEEPVRCFHFLYNKSREHPLTVVSFRNAYSMDYLPIYFYRDKNLNVLEAGDSTSGLKLAASISGGLWLSSDPQISPPVGIDVNRIYAYLSFRPEWPGLTRGARRMFVWSVSKPPSAKN